MPSGKTIVTSALTGFLFAGGWWVFIDGAINAPETFPWFHIIPGFGICICMIALNMVSLNNLDDWDYGGPLKCWVFTWLTLAMVNIGVAIWITAVEYPAKYNWPGVAIILQTMLIFCAGMLFLVSRKRMENF